MEASNQTTPIHNITGMADILEIKAGVQDSNLCGGNTCCAVLNLQIVALAKSAQERALSCKPKMHGAPR